MPDQGDIVLVPGALSVLMMSWGQLFANHLPAYRNLMTSYGAGR